MATYKVIQDIEAEDKFLGPLTLKQFIFAAITVVCAYLSFFFLTKGVWFLVLPLLPVMLVGGFLAFPWGRDQPTETWLLAKLRFFLKPHLRVWNQTGVQELVTITAPKKQGPAFEGDNLSQTEVKSRLRALADTIDSRGWAVKNGALNMMTAPNYAPAAPQSDRLVDIAMPAAVPIVDVAAADDIMDEHYNPVAQNFSRMIEKSEQTHRQATLQKMEQIREGKLPAPVGTAPVNDTAGRQAGQAGDNFWFMGQQPSGPVPAGYATFGTQTAAPAASSVPAKDMPLSSEEKALLDKIHKEKDHTQPPTFGHMKVILPPSQQKTKAKTQVPKPAPVDQPVETQKARPDPALMQLADNDDLNVATIARQANKKKEPPEDEVVISLR